MKITIGTAAPVLLVLALLADGASRFVSYEHVTFRPFEALLRSRGLGSPFLHNASIRKVDAYGDLASMANAPELRQYRTEVATTDEWGFRNAPGTGAREVGGLLFGSSFSMGAGLSDDQTLSARLEAHLGVPIYNAGGVDVGKERELTRVLSRLHFRSRIAIAEQMECAPQPVWAGAGSTLAMRLEERFDARPGGIRNGLLYAKGWLRESPLKLTLFKFFKKHQDDVILPNAFSGSVVRDELSNGDPILFLPEQIEPPRRVTAVADAVAFWTRLNQFFQQRGFEFVVVLVPSQYRVYGPHVRHPRPGLANDTYLDDLERGLRAANIAVVASSSRLMAAAREGLPEHRYVYWRDDTHWTAEGVELTAREIAERVRKFGSAASAAH